MQLTLLGTGSPVPSLKRASAGYLVTAGADVILLDHGPGANWRMMQAGVMATAVTHVVFSHLHFDHCLDFCRLYLNRWDMGAGKLPPLRIFGPPGTARFVDRLFGQDGAFAPDLTARTSHPQSLAFYAARGGAPPRAWPEAEVRELAEHDMVEGAAWRLTVANVPHQQPYLVSYGIRVEGEGGVLAYTSDITLPPERGPAKPLYALAQGADVLVHYLNSFSFVAGKASPQAVVATLARDCGVKTLITTHHGPGIDRDGVRERVIADIGAIYRGRIVWGQDLMRFTVGAEPALPEAGIGATL